MRHKKRSDMDATKTSALFNQTDPEIRWKLWNGVELLGEYRDRHSMERAEAAFYRAGITAKRQYLGRNVCASDWGGSHQS